MKKALLLEGIHPIARSELESAGFEVDLLSYSPGADELAERISDVDVVGIRSKTHITAEVLEHARKLGTVGAFCIGTNQIDLPACTRHGVGVFNAPFSNTRSVAELALAEITLLLRNLPDKMRALHEGHWLKSASQAHEVRGKSLGIVGYGKIGMQLSVLAEALGMQVFFYDRVKKLALGNAVSMTTLEALLERCDVISLHVDGRPENRNLIDAAALSHMKKGSILLNLSRGHVVDIDALAEALDEGRLRGAALDVYPEEPASKDAPFTSEMRGKKNVILTPHIGGSTEEAQLDIAEYVSSRLVAYAAYGISTGSVNLPELAPEHGTGKTRLAHLHENVPGMLAAINRVLAECNLNVTAQHLATLESVGYVLTDVDGELDAATLEKLSRLPHTLRSHQLAL